MNSAGCIYSLIYVTIIKGFEEGGSSVCTEIPPLDTSEGCVWENDQQLDGSLRLSEVVKAGEDLGVISIQQSPAGRTSKRAATWKTVGSCIFHTLSC